MKVPLKQFMEPRSAIRGLLETDWWISGAPNFAQTDGFNHRQIDVATWLDVFMDPAKPNLDATWGTDKYRPDLDVFACEEEDLFQVESPSIGVLEVVSGFFVSGALVLGLSEWSSEVRSVQRKRRKESSFKDGFGKNGVLGAFRGKGHDRLVSRRWLEHGPWAFLRHDATDVSIVLYRDPDEEDVDTIVAQAEPAHQRIGWTPEGGYLPPRYGGAGFDLTGTYLVDERRHVILVVGRTVSQEEMLAACAFRRDSMGTDKPVDIVTFTFMDETTARAHLHELWLRELECRCVIDGVEIRLDADHAPVPRRPEWAQRVEEKWQHALMTEAARLGL